MTRTAPQTTVRPKVRRALALTTALGMSLGVFATAANAQLPSATDFGVVTATAVNAGGVLPVITATPSDPVGAPTNIDTLAVNLNARNTVIDWNGFRVQAGSTATFSDTRATGAGTAQGVLNRVSGGVISDLSGTINAASNIQVWIVNGAGIMVGANANINVGSLVLSGLNVTDAEPFRTATGAYTVTAANALASTSAITGGALTAQIVTTGGTLALIAPRVDLTATTGSGTFATAYAIASDVSLTTSPGGPLAIVVNQGTAVAANQNIAGAMVGGSLYALITPQTAVNTLLNVSTGATTASATDGVVVLGGDNGGAALGPFTVNSGLIGAGPAIFDTGGTAAITTGGTWQANGGGAIRVRANGAIDAGGSLSTAGGGDVAVAQYGPVAATATVSATVASTGAYSVTAGRVALGAPGQTVTQAAAGAVSINATANTVGADGTLSLTGDTNDSGDVTTIGGAGTTGLAFSTTSTIKAGDAGAGTLIFRTATDSGQFLLGSVLAGTLQGQIGAGAAGDITRTGTISFGDLTLAGTTATAIDASGSADALDLQAISTSNPLTLKGGVGGVSFTTFGGSGNRVVTSLAGIDGTSIGGTGTVALTAAATSPISITGGLGTDAANRLGALTINGGSGVTIGTTGATGTTAFLTDATIGQTVLTPVVTLTINGGTDYSGAFISTTTGATTLGGVAGGGALTLTGASIGAGALSTSGAAAAIRLTSDTINVGAVSTIGATADVVADRQTGSATAALTATSLSAGRDVLVGQTSSFATLTLSGSSSAGRNFTTDATGNTALGNASAVTALDAASTTGAVTYATLTGAGSKTLDASTTISGTSITGAGAVLLTRATTIAPGTIGATGAGVGSLSVNGGALTLGGSVVTGAAQLGQGSGLTSIVANGAIDAGSLLATTSGAQTYNSTVATAAQTVLTSNTDLVTTTGLVNAGTNAGAGNRSLTITGRSVSTGLLQAGSSIGVTGNGTVAGNRNVTVGGADAGTGVTITADTVATTTVSGNVTARGGNYAATGGTLALTGGTQQATGATTLVGGVINASPGVVARANSDNAGGETLTVGDQNTTAFNLAGSTLQGSGNGTGSVLFRSAAATTPFAIGNVTAATLQQQIGAGGATAISRTGDISFGNLALSGTNTIAASGALTTGAVAVLNGAPALTLTAGTTLTVGAITNLAGGTGGVTLTSSGGNIVASSSRLAGTLTATATSGNIGFSGLVDGPGAVSMQASPSGGTSFASAVGSLTPLATFTSVGAGKVFLNGGSLRTVTGPTGAQSYGGQLVLGADTVLTGGTATFTGGVQGNDGVRDHDLALNFDQAQTLTGATFAGIRTLSTDAGGGTTIASDITTSGGQSYGDTVTLNPAGAGVVLTSTGGGAVSFAGLAGNGKNLTVTTAGTTTFTVGASGYVDLTTNGGGSTVLNGTMAGTGAQLFSDNVVLGSATIVTGGAGAVTFGGTVTGTNALTVTTGGLTSFNGAVGPIAALTSNGAGAIRVSGGSIATTGTQSYTGQVQLGANTVLSTSNANTVVTFGTSGVNGFTGGVNFDLAINTPGAQTIGSTITGVRNLSTDAAGTLNLAGSVTTTGSQSYGENVTLGGATTLTGGTTIGFGGTVDGAQTLSTNAVMTTFNGDVGQTAAPTSLAVTGTAATAGAGPRRITTAGAQTYNNVLALGADTILTGTGATIAAGVNGSASNFGLTLTFSAANALGANPFINVGNLLVNGAGTTTLNGNVTTVGSQSWTSAINIAAATALTSNGGQAITLNTVGGSAALTVATGGATNLNGTIGGINALTTDAGGTTTINTTTPIVTTSGKQTYGDNVVLGVNTVLTANGAAPGSGVIFNGTVTGARTLTTNSLGATAFNGVVGGLTGGAPDPAVSPVSISVAGPTTIGTTNVTTATTQNYAGLVTLGANTGLTGTVASFGGGVAGAGFDLTLNTSGAQALGGTITGVRNLTTDAAGTLSLAGAIATTGFQSYGEAVTLAGATTLSAGGTIGFASTVDGAQTLTTSATTTTFNADVGQTTALTALTVTGTAGTAGTGTRVIRTTGTQTYNNALALGLDTRLIGAAGVFTGGVNGSASNFGLRLTFSGPNALIANPFTNVGTLLVDGAGTTTLNGNVTTTGSQTWTSGINVAAATVLTSSTGQAITLNTIGGGNALTVATAGATNLNGAIGGITALTTDAGGTTTIDTAAITTTSGVQSYGDNVVLGVNTVLTANGTAAASGFAFGGTVTGPQSLTLTSAGQATFNGVVGAFAGGVVDAATSPTALISNGAGVVRVNGGAINTNGVQSYAGAVQLGADTVLRGTTGTFTGGIAGNSFDLRLSFVNPVTLSGSSGGFDDLLVDNAANLSGTLIANTQTYNGAVTLVGDATLRSGAAGTGTGAITFGTTVDAAAAGGQSLTVTTAGTTSFNAAGATRALSALSVNGTGATTLNGPTVTTTGAQSYTGPVTLTANNLLTTNGGNIAFAGTVTSPFQLSVQTIPTGTPVAGTVSFGGAVTVNGLAIRANAATAAVPNTVGTLAANVRSGGFAFTDTGALTIGTVDGLSGVASNTGAAAITAGGLLTVATNVSGTGVTLTGTGLTQNTGTIVNGGSGGVVLDGNDGAITLAGLVTSGNTGANAVLIRDASTVQLANVTTGAGGTLTLGAAGSDNVSGAVTQLTGTALNVGVVAGNVGGSATLTNANSIAGLGAFSSTGLALHTVGGLIVTGPVNSGAGDLTLTVDGAPLALQGALTTAGSATFSVGGAITQTAGSVVTANILTGLATGAVTLAGANQIANLGAFGVLAGGFQLVDARALTVTADESVTGNLNIAAIGLDFTGRSLTASGTATLDAGSGALTGASVTGTGVTLTGASAAVTTATATTGALAVTSTNGALSLGAGSAGTTATLSAAGTLDVTGALTSGGAASLTATGAATVASVESTGASVLVRGASVTVPFARSRTTLTVQATAGDASLTTGATTGAGGNALVSATGNVTLGTLGTTAAPIQGTATVTAGGTITGSSVIAAGAAALTAGGNLDLTTLTAGGGAITGTVGDTATIGTIAASTDLTLQAGAAAIGSATAGTGALSLRTTNNLTLGTGTAGSTALLQSGGALTIATSLIGGNSAANGNVTTTSTGATTIGAVQSRTGAVSVTGASAGVTTANASSTLLIRGTAGGVTLGTGTAGGAATLDAAGPLTIATSLSSAATATTSSTGATTIGSIVANGGAVAVTGQSVAITTVRGSTTLDANATGGNLTVGTGTASGGAATLRATGTVGTTALTASGAVAITAGGAATLGTTTSGAAVNVMGTSIAAGQTAAATTLTFTGTGNISLTGNSTTGTAATFDSGGTASLGQVTASGGTGSTITVKALDAAITGILRAGTVSFVNRTPANNAFKLGTGTTTGGFALSTDEISFVDAAQLTIDGGSGNVEIGTLAFGAGAGRTRVDVLTTGRIDVSGAVSGAGAGRTFRLGGTAANTTDKAAVIRVVATVDAGGRLLFAGHDLDLRGAKIGVGQAPGFLDPIGFGPGGSPLSAATVAGAYIANPNSSLYNATFGGNVYTDPTAALVSARSLTVRYTDYALFQNTGAPGTNLGAVLGTAANPSMPALVLQASGSTNALAIFGLINGIGDTGAAVTGSSVLQVTGADLANTRVNGCIAGSGAGCLTSVVSQPLLNIFDSSRLAVFRAADDLALPFDPAVGTNNEALFSGFGLIEGTPTDTECGADTTSPGCGQDREQGK